MNYRHAFHAGNFADVVKHAALAYLLSLMAAKPKPMVFIDTHAGIGRYDLASVEAFRGGEAKSGVQRLWTEIGRAPAALKPYLDAVAAENPGRGDLLFYPGSPALAARLLRSEDRLLLFEKHPEDCDILSRLFADDGRIRIADGDGWTAVKALLPPQTRRGLILIDPPFEEAGEFDRMIRALKEAYRRFQTGVYLLWYPIKDEVAVASFRNAARDLKLERMLNIEFRVARESGLSATGLLIVNPTWPFAEDFGSVLEFLGEVLEGKAQISWI